MKGNPHNLSRFLTAQDGAPTFEDALNELKQGRKMSCWIWYIFPQAAGLVPNPSENTKKFAIDSRQEAEEYLKHEKLGPRLVACVNTLLKLGSNRIEDVMGGDGEKLRSSMTLFAEISANGSPFHKVLDKYWHSELDQKTLRFLKHSPISDADECA